MRKQKRIICGFVILTILFMNNVFNKEVAAINLVDETKQLLLIVENDSVYNDEFIFLDGFTSYNIVEFRNLQFYDADNYEEIAAPYTDNMILNQMLENGYNAGKKIYLYGALTIDDFCEVINLQEFSIQVPLETMIKENTIKENTIEESVTMRFDDEYEAEEIHNVIAARKNSPEKLLVSIPKDESGNYNLSLLMKAVADDLSISAFGLIDHATNIKTYTIGGQYAILDWYLYETEENYVPLDFYGIKTNLALEGGYYGGLNYLGERMYTTISCVGSTDNLFDSAPGSSYQESTFDVNLQFGEETYASLGWSFTMNSEPNITRTQSLAEDYVSWVVEGDAQSLEGEIFSPGMTWNTTTNFAKINIQFRGYFESTVKGLYDYTSWKTVEVCFP